jgi:hypothetical protein
LLGLASIAIAVLIGLQQYVTIGEFIQIEDALHHEFLIAVFGAFGLGIILGTKH